MINSEGTQEDSGLSPGKRLSQGRLQLGLTQEQVAKDLYITLAKIKALESDDYGRINNETFIRGYIRAYANLVKIDVVEVLAAYDRLLQERHFQAEANAAVEASVAAKSAPPVSPGKSGLQLLLVIAAFFLGLWLISVWFFNNQSDEHYAALAPVVTEELSSVESESSAAVSSLVQSSADPSSVARSAANMDAVRAQAPLLVNSSAAKSVAASASSSKNRSTASRSAQSASASSSIAATSSFASASSSSEKLKSSALDTISFSFRAECWLEVSDSRGDVLATELQAPGSSLTLVGKAPFDVKLGNAPAVAIELNGKKIDVIPLLGTNVLSLRVSN